MFVRILRMKLEPDGTKDFARTVDDEAIPVLKKSPGFLGQVPRVSRDSQEAAGFPLWDRKKSAETYKKERAAAVLKALEKHVAEKPDLRTCEVTNIASEKLLGRKAA